MQHTRKQIIEYLRVNRTGSSIEMSHALSVTPANIRHHLKLLKEVDLVEVLGQEPIRGRGRPTKLYRLTDKALTDNLGGLASALLKTILMNTTETERMLGCTASHLLGDNLAVTNIHIQLNRAVEKLNQMKYQASWEASLSGPRLILKNCPYAPILSENPELCQLDRLLLARLLNQPVEQTAKLERSSDGSPHCAFVACTS